MVTSIRVVCAMALNAASTGPSPEASQERARPSVCLIRSSAWDCAAAVCLDIQPIDSPQSLVPAARKQHQRLDVTVEQLLLAICQSLEVLKDAVELGVLELIAQLLDALAKCMATAVLPEH